MHSSFVVTTKAAVCAAAFMTAGVFVAAAGCSAGTSTTSGVDGSADGALQDGPANDGNSGSDGALVDGSTGDGGGCKLMGGTYDKTCTTADDCLMVSVGCYCGAQPIIGVAKTAQPAAAACESQARAQCGLGCPNAPGHVGEDGQNDEGTGRNLTTLCDDNKCHTVLEP